MFEDLVNALFQNARSPARRRRGGTRLDKLQAAADAVGVADQSGVTDMTNAAISALRAMRAKDPAEKKEHWKDAGIRAFSAIPVIGDLAKVGRARKYVQTFKSSAPSATGARAAVGTTAAASGPRDGFLKRIAQAFSLRGESIRSPRQVSESAAAARAPGNGPAPLPLPRAPEGLSAGEKLKMMGQGRDQIDLADKSKRAREEEKIRIEEANAAMQDMKDALKKLTAGGSGAIVALASFPKIVQRWTEAIVESRRHLAQFDARMAGAYAKLDIDRTMRDIRTAQETGGSSAELARQLSVLEDSLRQLKSLGITVTNIAALLAAGNADMIAGAINAMLGPLFTLQQAAEKWLGGGRTASMPLHDVVQNLIDRGNAPQVPPAPLPPL